MQQILRLLGDAANQRAERTSNICLETAARSLEDLLSDRRFARDNATELLAIDALTTYAFEHASQSVTSQTELEELANQGTDLFARLADRD